MTKLSCGPLWKENNKWENVGYVLYSFHDWPHALYVVSGVAGVSRGAKQSPPLGSGAAPRTKFVFCANPLIGGSAHGFVHGFAHGFGVRWFSAPGI